MTRHHGRLSTTETTIIPAAESELLVLCFPFDERRAKVTIKTPFTAYLGLLPIIIARYAYCFSSSLLSVSQCTRGAPGDHLITLHLTSDTILMRERERREVD